MKWLAFFCCHRFRTPFPGGYTEILVATGLPVLSLAVLATVTYKLALRAIFKMYNCRSRSINSTQFKYAAVGATV